MNWDEAQLLGDLEAQEARMSDDLVERLQNPRPLSMFLTRADQAKDWAEQMKAAADRIEELEAQITAMEEGLTAVHMAGYMDGKKATEAKLAKAVEALRGWIEFANEEGMPVAFSDLEAAGLTGGKDE